MGDPILSFTVNLGRSTIIERWYNPPLLDRPLGDPRVWPMFVQHAALVKMGSERPNARAEMMRLSVLAQQSFSSMLCYRRQRGADDWVWRADWRANYATSPTFRSHPKAQSLEQGADHWAEATAAS